jgi:hypothetical protein
MAGSQITVYVNQVIAQRLGWQSLSFTHFSDTSEPLLAAGSKVEIGGALYEFTADESITGWSGISVSSNVYVKLTVSGASVTAAFTTTAPTWDTAKQGWYSGSDRYVGGLYKDSGGNYTLKWVYEIDAGGVAWCKRYGSGLISAASAAGQVSADGGNAVLSSTRGAYSTGLISGAGTTYVIPAGTYYWFIGITTTGSPGPASCAFQIRDLSSAWNTLSAPDEFVVGESINGFVHSDGTNYRFSQISSGSSTWRLQKVGT